MSLIEDLRGQRQYLTTKEVMRLLRVGRNTLCGWVRAGRIPAIRTAGGYRFDPFVLTVWLAERTTATRSKRGAA
jgi:excisionase family DNA binding protein